MPSDIKSDIKTALANFTAGILSENALNLFDILGYNTERRNPLDEPTYGCFIRNFGDGNNKFKPEKALTDNWTSVDLLFQVTKSEILKSLKAGSAQQEMDFGTEGNIGVNKAIIESYLFFAIGLNGERYTRTQLSDITREVNRLFPMPVMVLFKHGDTLTISVINRRINKKDGDKDVLEKVTLIKDIRIENPHRAHLDILFDLSFGELQRKNGFSDFVELHKAWQKTLDTKELNKQFYLKLFNWYLFALQLVRFPQIRPETDMVDDKLHQSESLIRLLTRMLFVWFMKEKGLIKPELFDDRKLRPILRSFTGAGSDETIYYKAILQNLFFATLNKPIDQRKVIDKGFNPREYGDPLVYRFDELFADPGNLLSYFENIPFLNGGLFDCLDQKKDAENAVEIRLDGFSTKKQKQVIFPDKLFFGEYKEIDLSRDYDDKKKNRVTVFGLIDILQQYKFTIEENTPVEEEVALDPELLGKVFENLLASYNPETQSTARKQTGSFYTPREIVNYMVDESLIAYLKNHLDDEPRLRQLFSYETAETANPFDETETLVLLKAIDGCKILDPACGSGAFPMGVLQKMIHVLHRLDPENTRWFDMVVGNFPSYMQAEVRKRLEKENWNYVRKLGIIQQCLYGVDIQPIATQIAKLRFFIALLVDQTEKPGEPNRGFEPLPNLDFKIVTANTLIAAPKNDAIDAYAKPAVAQFESATNDYFAASAENKGKLKIQIKKAIDEIVRANQIVINQWMEKSRRESNSATGAKLKKMKEQQAQFQRDLDRWNTFPNLFKYESVTFFEPKYFFPQVKEGFDVVIGNPPYVSALELKKSISEHDYNYLKSNFQSAVGTVDYYIYFFEKGLMLLKENGILSFISPNRYLSASYGEALRELLFNITTIISIIDYSNVRVFKEASVYPIVSLIKNTQSTDYNLKIGKYSEENNNLIFKLVKSEKLNFTEGFMWGFLLNEKIQITEQIIHQSVPIISACKINATTTASESDSYHNLINENSGYKLINTGTIDRYCNLWGKEFLTDKRQKFHRPFLPKKSTIISKNRHSLFSSPKILFAKIAIRTEAFHDKNGEYASINTNCFHTFSHDYDPAYILAWVNSKLFQFTFECFFDGLKMQGGYLLYSAPNLSSMFIKKIDRTIQKPFSLLVDYVNFSLLLNIESTFWDVLIDLMFYELYFPEQIHAAGCGVMQYLTNLPELTPGDEAKNLEIIEKVYHELSDPAHPVSVAMAKMQEVEEVRVIEGVG